MGTETTHCRVGTQGLTHSTRWAAVWAIRRPAHDGQNPRRLQLKGSSSSCWHVSQPSRRKPWATHLFLLFGCRRFAQFQSICHWACRTLEQTSLAAQCLEEFAQPRLTGLSVLITSTVGVCLCASK